MCGKGPWPLDLGPCFLKDRLNFTSSPSFNYVFLMSQFFDGLLAEQRFRIILRFSTLDFLRSTFLRMSHLSARGPSGMVFEHLQDVFDFEDFANSFIQLH